MPLGRLPLLALSLVLALFAVHPRAQSPVTAIVGATVIDGTGGSPVADAVVLIEGARIRAVGPRAATPVPPGATTIDATGRFVVPGFIDTNVHLSLYGGQNERYETLVRYYDRQEAIVLEAAQLQLRYGVTTVRDSYGVLPALVAVRDRIARGEAVGARILAAGNIVGWGGPYSVSFSLIPERNLTRFQEQMNDLIAQGVGEDLVDLSPDELRAAIRAYLDKGPDFIKYGGTAHFSRPAFIGFSPEAQKAIVEETHARGKIAETHATTPDGLRLAILAGIDLIQHPEVLGPRELPDDIVRLIVERRIVCSMLANTIAGPAWKKHLEDKAAAEKRLAEEAKKAAGREKTSAERRKEAADLGTELEMRRRNAETLIRAGAVVTVGTDNYWAAAPELARTPKPEHQDHGIGTIIGIEGLVELGMTPMQALVAATRNGAVAAGRLKDLGTIEAGKLADLVVLDADPLAAIDNIRAVRLVIQEGRVVDRDRLPERRVLSRPPATTSSAGEAAAGGAAAAAAMAGVAPAAAGIARAGSGTRAVNDALAATSAPTVDRRQEAAGTGRPAEYPIAAVPLTAVRLTDEFWRPRLERNRTVTIPHILRQNEITGRVDNFLKAARRMEGPHKGQRYNDTDVYKVIEAASYVLAAAPDPELDRKLDALIATIAAAQEPDGYLYTPRTVDPKNPAPGAGPERWSYLHTSHELYNAGHLYEAAVAHYRATGKRTLLDVATRNADLVCRVFGPGRRLDAPGHQEIELALVKLFRVTGDRRYLDQAKFFLEQRGRPHTVPPAPFEPGSRFAIYNDLAYRQDHLPVVEQTRATGHAVRATYMFAGMTDVGVLTADETYLRTLDAVWRDVVTKRMYLTGGLGSQGRTEAFGGDYALPSRRAYAETCASIGGILWYHRMFRREGDGRYLDVLERTLYNGYLSGVSQGGDTFFYQNPLEADGSVARSVYFDVACCPANLARLMAQLPGLVYAHRGPELFVNLFVASEAAIDMAGTTLRLVQRTAYPWDGRVELQLDPVQPVELELRVRVPGWARGEAVPGDLYRYADAGGAAPRLSVNGEGVPLDLDRGFARIRRRWQAGDRLVLDLPMPARRVLAHEAVADARGKAAIERGPLVYAVEAADNGGRALDLRLPLDAPLRHEHRANLLGGVTIVTATATRVGASGSGQPHPLVAVPYYAWANRGKGEMAVWIPFE